MILGMRPLLGPGDFAYEAALGPAWMVVARVRTLGEAVRVRGVPGVCSPGIGRNRSRMATTTGGNPAAVRDRTRDPSAPSLPHASGIPCALDAAAGRLRCRTGGERKNSAPAEVSRIDADLPPRVDFPGCAGSNPAHFVCLPA